MTTVTHNAHPAAWLDPKQELAYLVSAFKADLLEREHAPDSSRHYAAAIYRRTEGIGDAWKADPGGYSLPDLLQLAVQLTWLAPFEEQSFQRGADLAWDTEDDAIAAALLIHFAAAFAEFAREHDEGCTLEGMQMFLVVSYLRHLAGKPNALVQQTGRWIESVVREGLRKELGKDDVARFAKKHPALAHLLAE